jgi:hypothetical protein
MSLQVEDDPAVGRAVALDAVPAAPDRELDAGLAGEIHDGLDVGVRANANDGARLLVDAAVHHDARRLVVRVAGFDHPAGESPAKGVEMVIDGAGRDRHVGTCEVGGRARGATDAAKARGFSRCSRVAARPLRGTLRRSGS